MPVPLLELRQVSKSYVSGETSVSVLKNANLTVFSGEGLAIVGPSGSGKSTILNLLGTLDLPDSGLVSIAGRNIAGLKPQELAELRNHEIGLVFQAHHLLPQCSVLENALIPVLANGRKAPPEIIARAHTLIQRVGLGSRANHLPGRLSGGERQRAAVVRALINSPKIVLADEPTGALDHQSALEIGQLLSELNRTDHVTMVVVTHSPELAARFGRIVEVREGLLTERIRPTSPPS